MLFLITNIIKQTGYIGPKCKLLHITSKQYHASVLNKICVPENVEPGIYSPSTEVGFRKARSDSSSVRSVI